MTAVDTNIVVRLVTGDDPKQTHAARSLLTAGPIWIAKTVWLETFWVLRSVHGYDDTAIHDAFTELLGLDNVQAEDEASVAAALALIAYGLDFADALHLSSRPAGAAFVSFDKALVRCANRAGAPKVSTRPMLR
jgi:predicted nucleic-acid-binding protein